MSIAFVYDEGTVGCIGSARVDRRVSWAMFVIDARSDYMDQRRQCGKIIAA